MYESPPDVPYTPNSDLSRSDWQHVRDLWEASPANWYTDATRWKTAARTLVDKMLRLGWPSPPPRHRATVGELDRAAVLLFGLALESLVKGLSLRRTWKTARTIGHHAGKEAATLVECSQSELELFSRLEECVSTIGRYPIPDNGTPGTVEGHPFRLRPDDPDTVEVIWQRLAEGFPME